MNWVEISSFPLFIELMLIDLLPVFIFIRMIDIHILWCYSLY